MALTADQAFELDRMNNTAFRLTLGTEIKNIGTQQSTDTAAIAVNTAAVAVRQLRSVRASYDFDVDGGAQGAINLRGIDGEDVIIPDNAVIKQATIDILTGMTSGTNAATIALDSEGAGDLLVAVQASTLSGIEAGVPVGTAATMIKLTAARTLTVTVANGEDLTAGKFDLFVEYYDGQ